MNGEEFYLYIPEGYSSTAVTNITYNGLSGLLYNGTSFCNFSSSDVGKYVKLRYSYTISGSGRESITFTIVD